MKKFLITMLVIVITGLCFMPLIMQYAETERGYPAFGGEHLMLIALVAALVEIIIALWRERQFTKKMNGGNRYEI